MTDPTEGTVRIGALSRTLPILEARDLFLAAGVARAKGLLIAIDHNTMIAIGQAETVTFTAEDGFIEEYDPAAFLNTHGRKKTR